LAAAGDVRCLRARGSAVYSVLAAAAAAAAAAAFPAAAVPTTHLHEEVRGRERRLGPQVVAHQPKGILDKPLVRLALQLS
jgi:hypothetical protein